jgi:tetratricopeptide (TPR) repeat protein
LRAFAAHDLAARSLFDLAVAHARLDESEEALLAALECERALTAAELVDRTLELQVRALLASAYARRGDFAAADLQTERASALATEVSSSEARAPARSRSEALLLIARALRAQRAPVARLRRAYDAALAALDGAPPGTRARVLRDYGDALDAAGDATGAIAHLRAALDLLRPAPPV